MFLAKTLQNRIIPAQSRYFTRAMSNYRVITETVLKPDLDDRSYKLIELPNQLQALVIHDPTTDKSAASLDCRVGAFNDPKDLPGLAHFLEHLLFMGTEKYPNENDYASFLSNHSGHSNAYTSKLNTNYYFEINYNYLEGALDRFAQFFIHPLFNKNCKDREIKAVDSENKKNLQNDIWRLSQLDKSLSNPNHPHSGFSTGNLDTLGVVPLQKGLDVRNELISFYETHYSANLMRLVVLGREDLDTLTNWVVDKFSSVPNKSKSKSVYNDPPLTKKELKTIIKAKPVMNTKSLELTFTAPDQVANWEIQPQRYYSHLIGHESKGSILSLLKEKGWASGLSCGSMNISKGFSVFAITVDLTDKGLDHYEAICLHIFEYIKLLNFTGPQEWVFNELKDISALNFKFKQKSGASGTVSKLSSVLNKIHESLPEEYILSQNVLRKYDADLIREYGEQLTPENFRIMLVSPTFTDLPSREQWYGTEYSIEPLPETFVSKLASCSLNPDLHLPKANEFIPSNFSVEKKPVDQPLKAPSLLKADGFQRLWFKKDDQFWVPKGTVSTMFHLPVSQSTPFNSALTVLYLELVDDFLNDISYDASIVGLHFNLNPTRDGFSLKISGYNDKVTVLLDRVLETFLTFRPTLERFNSIKEKILKDYKNFGYAVPYGQVGYYSTFLLYDQSWTIDEKIDSLERIQHDDVNDFIQLLFKQVFFESLVHGNFHKEAALQIGKLYESKFGNFGPVAGSQLLTGRSVLMNPSSYYRYDVALKDVKNVNSCIEYFIQLGELTDLRKLTLADLVAQVTHEPCFNELRTKQQLGYVVFSGVKKTRTTFGYRVLIQSERTTDYLEYRIDEFLKSFKTKLAQFTQEDFKKNVESLVAKKLLKVKNLGDEYNRMWGKIGSGYHDFESNEQQVAILNSLQLEDLVDYYDKEILAASSARLVVHLKADSPLKQDKKKLINITISNSVEGISSNELEELVNARDFGGYASSDILSFLESSEFRALLPADALSASFSTASLHSAILSDLENPVPASYPGGELIGTIADFKVENMLTAAAKSVTPLAQFLDKELNGNAKL